MSKVILFNKPYGVISQFSPNPPHPTLKEYIEIPGVYPAGRLDTDSEGLMILTDDGVLQAKISDPKFKKYKTYWVQVEGIANQEQLEQLRQGIDLGDFKAATALVEIIEEPTGLWARTPPVRFRKTVPTSWLQISINEGKNRQVRRMTTKVGLPTLRLVRVAIGGISLADLAPGEWKAVAYLDFIKQFNHK